VPLIQAGKSVDCVLDLPPFGRKPVASLRQIGRNRVKTV
jgi:hypothetical protein